MIDTSGTDETLKENNLKNYINAHLKGRIIFFYSDGNFVRTKLGQLTLGKDLDPPIDLWSYLRLRVPSTSLLGGLKECGLVEFDRTVLLQSLDHLLNNGFDPKEYYSIRDFLHHWHI